MSRRYGISGLTDMKESVWTPTRVIVISFVVIIFVGSLLLVMPFSLNEGESVSYIDSLFTSTSATCVTGLSVFTVVEKLNFNGQLILLLLIQIGGLGFMTLSTAVYFFVGKKLSLSVRFSQQEDMSSNDLPSLKRITLGIVLMTFIFELFGAAVLFLRFYFHYGYGFETAIWKGVFHAVSAFCNAGFDVIGADNLIPFGNDPIILLTIVVLIVIGGIGFLVIQDVFTFRKRNTKKLRQHSIIVLIVTGALILVGTLAYMILEFNNPSTIGEMNFFDKLVNSLFLSVSTRTAGFTSFPLSGLTDASIVVSNVLMFIGASPTSTGGGIKTATLFVLLCAVIAVIRQEKEIVIDKKKVGSNLIIKAGTTFIIAICALIVSVFTLTLTDGWQFTTQQLLFEQVSAYSTCGLSLGITSGLSFIGKLVIILNMFFGRVGALTIFIALAEKAKRKVEKIDYLDSDIFI